jgi:hypothetical protein
MTTKTNLIKIFLKRDCLIDNKVVKAGATVEVSKEDAEEFCKPLTGLPAFEGERSRPQFHDNTRAELVK